MVGRDTKDNGCFGSWSLLPLCTGSVCVEGALLPAPGLSVLSSPHRAHPCRSLEALMKETDRVLSLGLRLPPVVTLAGGRGDAAAGNGLETASAPAGWKVATPPGETASRLLTATKHLCQSGGVIVT